ncbi:hypothetical protein D3C80_2045200 [compost metagenome]
MAIGGLVSGFGFSYSELCAYTNLDAICPVVLGSCLIYDAFCPELLLALLLCALCPMLDAGSVMSMLIVKWNFSAYFSTKRLSQVISGKNST